MNATYNEIWIECSVLLAVSARIAIDNAWRIYFTRKVCLFSMLLDCFWASVDGNMKCDDMTWFKHNSPSNILPTYITHVYSSSLCFSYFCWILFEFKTHLSQNYPTSFTILLLNTKKWEYCFNVVLNFIYLFINLWLF